MFIWLAFAKVEEPLRINRCNNIRDFRTMAQRRLPGPIFHYIDGAADDEVTYRRNTEAYERCADGKRLHDANCVGCRHDTSIYTRKDRLVQSLDALKKRLGDCSHMANKEFSASETQNIIKYLNDQFYQFR
jgi:hypothetical protein